MRQITYGPGGYDPDKPAANVVADIEVDVPDEAAALETPEPRAAAPARLRDRPAAQAAASGGSVVAVFEISRLLLGG